MPAYHTTIVGPKNKAPEVTDRRNARALLKRTERLKYCFCIILNPYKLEFAFYVETIHTT